MKYFYFGFSLRFKIKFPKKSFQCAVIYILGKILFKVQSCIQKQKTLVCMFIDLELLVLCRFTFVVSLYLKFFSKSLSICNKVNFI